MSRRPSSKLKRRRAPIAIGTAENGRRVFLAPEHRAVHTQVVGASGKQAVHMTAPDQLQNVKLTLAKWEPSTHDPKRTFAGQT